MTAAYYESATGIVTIIWSEPIQTGTLTAANWRGRYGDLAVTWLTAKALPGYISLTGGTPGAPDVGPPHLWYSAAVPDVLSMTGTPAPAQDIALTVI